MKSKEVDHSHHGATDASSHQHDKSEKSKGKEYSVDGSRRVGGWGVVEVNDDKRRWIYADDPEGLKRLKAKEEKEKAVVKDDEMSMEHVQRYEMAAKRIW